MTTLTLRVGTMNMYANSEGIMGLGLTLFFSVHAA